MIRMASSRTKRKVKLHQTKNQAWLTTLLKINFYGDEDSECKKHRRKYKTRSCIDCMSEPFCDSCRWEFLRHAEHHVLQILRCSKRAGIRKKDIEKLVTVTEIQPFVINNHKIVFLQERDTKGKPMCKQCRGRMVESDYRFCSIACQVQAENVAENEASAVIQSCSAREAMKNHLASRSRKGIPFRSPLF